MCKDTFLSDAVMEEVIFEDLPSNLSAIRDYIENQNASKSSVSRIQIQGSKLFHRAFKKMKTLVQLRTFVIAMSNVTSQQRSKVSGLQRNIEVLKSELLKFIAEHG